MDTPSIFTALIFLLAGLAHNYGLKPPSVATSLKDTRTIYRGQFFEKVVLMWAVKTRILVGLSALGSAVTIASTTMPTLNDNLALGSLCPYPRPALRLLSITTPSLIFGVACMVTGCLLRMWCYSTLGELFTFHVGVFDSHSLVTHGPYAIVRHPSYAALAILLSSTAWVFLALPGNYIAACGLMQTNWRFMVYYWVVGVTVSFLSLYRRGDVEDNMLKERFGEKWVVYKNDVPYKFVPYIL